jgi:hypothetical protein
VKDKIERNFAGRGIGINQRVAALLHLLRVFEIARPHADEACRWRLTAVDHCWRVNADPPEARRDVANRKNGHDVFRRAERFG